MKQRAEKRPEVGASTHGTRDAVETAFELAKECTRGTWEGLVTKLSPRFPRWESEGTEQTANKTQKNEG